MKKLFLLTGIILITALTTLAAEVIYSNIFINKFLHCLPSTVTYTLTGENGDINVKMGMHGWKNRACRYSETRTEGDTTTNYNCNFTRDQVNELVSAMKSDPTGEGVAQQTWERYKKTPEVCMQPNQE